MDKFRIIYYDSKTQTTNTRVIIAPSIEEASEKIKKIPNFSHINSIFKNIPLDSPIKTSELRKYKVFYYDALYKLSREKTTNSKIVWAKSVKEAIEKVMEVPKCHHVNQIWIQVYYR